MKPSCKTPNVEKSVSETAPVERLRTPNILHHFSWSGRWVQTRGGKHSNTDWQREWKRERLQNRVMNAREEWRLWHGWAVWGMREWFDSRVQDVPIRWIYFPWIDGRLHRRLITHSPHPCCSRRTTGQNCIVHASRPSYLSWNRLLEIVCSLCDYVRDAWTGRGVTAAAVVISEQMIKPAAALSLWDQHTHHQCGKLTPDIS